MFPRRVLAGVLLPFIVAAIPTRATDTQPADDRAVANLAAFARIYGYVRFFHPSDQAVAVDWDKLGIFGAEAVRGAPDRDGLRTALLRVFRPIAPQLRLTDAASPGDATEPTAPLATGPVTSWQYFGINLSANSGPYQNQRSSIALPPFTKQIAARLVLQLPLALPVGAEGKTVDDHPAEFAALQTELSALDLNSISPSDWRLRVAGVVTVWNVFQHFHPYLDGIGVKWDEALESALRRALRDQTADDYYATLSELVAKSQDGHGYVYGQPQGAGGIPIRLAEIEDRLVVTGVAEGAPFQKGDIIESIDHVPAFDLLRDRERYVSGSPHLRRFRALNQFGGGPVGSVAQVAIVRDGTPVRVEFTRTPERRGYFFNQIGEFEFPAFAEVRPGVFYVNLYSLDRRAFEAKLPLLADAQGVIFDDRWDGRDSASSEDNSLQPHRDIIPHLIDQTIQASPMLVPKISLPDRAGWSYREFSWPVEPKAPRFKGRIVFINEPSVVSYGETCMAMIADYHLATLVGAPTAGCNGNVNFIPLPGGFRVMFTGMDVRKHDRSPFYSIGFTPDLPVARHLSAVKEGRDEYLEKAIEVITGSAELSAPGNGDPTH